MLSGRVGGVVMACACSILSPMGFVFFSHVCDSLEVGKCGLKVVGKGGRGDTDQKKGIIGVKL